MTRMKTGQTDRQKDRDRDRDKVTQSGTRMGSAGLDKSSKILMIR